MAATTVRRNTPPEQLVDGQELTDVNAMIPIIAVKLPNSSDLASIAPFHADRSVPVTNPDGTPFMVDVVNPVIKTYVGNEEMDKIENVPVYLYYVPVNVFQFFRAQSRRYDDFGAENWFNSLYDGDAVEEALEDFYEGKMSTSTDYDYVRIGGIAKNVIPIDALAIITHWYLLKLQDPVSAAQLASGTYDVTSQDLQIIDSFFGNNYNGAENQKEFFANLMLVSHGESKLLSTEFERVMTVWFANLLNGKSLEELRVLTGAVDDLHVYNADGTVMLDDDGQPVETEAAKNLKREFPIETVQILEATGQPVSDELREMAAIAQVARDEQSEINAKIRKERRAAREAERAAAAAKSAAIDAGTYVPYESDPGAGPSSGGGSLAALLSGNN